MLAQPNQERISNRLHRPSMIRPLSNPATSLPSMACPREIKFMNDRRRRLVTYRKRKDNLKKAAEQLSTLCSAPTAVIFFDPDGRPDRYPEDDREVRAIIARNRRPLTQKDCIGVINQLKGIAAAVSEDKDQNLKSRPLLDDLPEERLEELANSIRSTLEPIRRRIKQLKDAERSQNNHCSTTEQGQYDLDHTSIEYPDAPIESTTAWEQSGGFAISAEDSVNPVNSCSSTSTSFNHGPEAIDSLSTLSLPVSLPSTSEHNRAFGSEHPFFPQDSSFGSLESPFLTERDDASTRFPRDMVMASDPYPVNNAFVDAPMELNRVNMCSSTSPSLLAPLPSTSEHNGAFGSGHPFFPQASSFGFSDSLFLMGDNDASTYLDHGHETMDSLVPSALSSFATSPYTTAVNEGGSEEARVSLASSMPSFLAPSIAINSDHNKTFDSGLASLPQGNSFNFPQSQFPMEGGDTSTHLNHSQEATGFLASSAPLPLAPAIAANSDHNKDSSSNLASLLQENSFGFSHLQILMGGGDASIYLNHGQEAIGSPILSTTSLFAISPSTAAYLEYCRAFGNDFSLPSLKSSFGVLENQYLIRGGDTSTYLNHGQKAMDSSVLAALSSFGPLASITATSEHNIEFGGGLSSNPPESSSSFSESQFPKEGGESSSRII